MLLFLDRCCESRSVYVICCLLAAECSLFRLHKPWLCVSHQPPVAGQMEVCVCVCACVGGWNWVEQTAMDCKMRGFPSLSFSLFLLIFCGLVESVTSIPAAVKIE